MVATTRRRTRPLRKAFGKVLLTSLGWRVEGALPDTDKYVIIAAPHTTNWDLPIMLGVAYVLGANLSWMGKHTVFQGPFGGFMRWLGGIPVDRRSHNDVVKQMVAEFARRDELALSVPPEGTRRRTAYWKSGFYYIAKGAHVPIALGFLDYRRKVGGVGPVLMPTDDLEADLAKIRAFYSDKAGKFPEKFQNAVFRPADEPDRQKP